MLEGLLLTLDVLAMLILMRWSMVQDRAQKKTPSPPASRHLP
jgi:hypothetical protein